MIAKMTVAGPIPSKKNSRLTFSRGNKIINIPSNEYAAWNKAARLQLINAPRTHKTVVRIALTFFFKTNHRADLSNKAESVMDLLVECLVIADDSWQHIPRLDLISGGIDKLNPRCEIEILFSDEETAKAPV